MNRPPDPMAPHVRRVLEEAGLTQVRIAAALGVEQTAISKRYRGSTSWRASELHTISTTFGIPLSRLYGTESEPEPDRAAEEQTAGVG